MKLEKRDPVKKNSADAKHRLLQSICIKGVGFEIYIEFFPSLSDISWLFDSSRKQNGMATVIYCCVKLLGWVRTGELGS